MSFYRSNNELLIITPPAELNSTGLQFIAYMSLADHGFAATHGQLNVTIRTNIVFIYKENPDVQSIEPNSVITW